MSVCCQCVKTTADSEDKYNKTIFLNLSDSYLDNNIFDSDQSIVESNNCEEIKKNYYDISLNLAFMKLK